MKMKWPGRLQLERQLLSLNPVWLVLVAVSIAAAVFWFGLAPSADLKRQAQALQLQALRDQVMQTPLVMADAAAAVPGSDQPLRAVLGEVSQAEQHVGTLLKLAQAMDMTAAAGEYKLSCDAAAGLCRYRVRLPLQGSYLQVRAFIEQSLLELPFASLDELSLRRESIGVTELEAGVVFSLHMAYPAGGEPVTEARP